MHFEKVSLNFSKFWYPSLGQTKNIPWSSLLAKKKLIGFLVLNLKVMFSALVKLIKKDFRIVLTGKQQKCRHRAPLRHLLTPSSIPAPLDLEQR